MLKAEWKSREGSGDIMNSVPSISRRLCSVNEAIHKTSRIVQFNLYAIFTIGKSIEKEYKVVVPRRARRGRQGGITK